MDLVDFAPAVPMHGNYVGPGYTGGRTTHHAASSQAPVAFAGTVAADYGIEPVDALDAAAQRHDWRYGAYPRDKALADAFLAGEAWDAAKQHGLTAAGLRAGAVAAGASIMAAMGSRTGAAALDVPVFRKRARSGVPANDGLVGVEPNPGPAGKTKGNFKNTRARSALRQGNNRKGGGQAILAPRREKLMREVAARVEREERVERSAPSRGKDEAATYMARGIPSTLPATVSVTRHAIAASGPGWVRLTGRQRLVDVGYSGTPAPGQAVYVQPVDSALFAQTKLREFFNTYENWHPNMLRFELVPTSGTTTPGKYLIYVEPDPNDPVVLGQVYAVDGLANKRGVPECTLYGAAGVALLQRDPKLGDLWTSPVADVATAAEDNRLSSAGFLAIVSSSGVGANPTYGTLYVNYDVTFRLPTETDNETMALNALVWPGATSTYATAGIGSGVAAGALSWNLGNMLALARGNAAVDPTYFFSAMTTPSMSAGIATGTPRWTLPPGDYVVRVAVYAQNLNQPLELRVRFVPPTGSGNLMFTHSHFHASGGGASPNVQSHDSMILRGSGINPSFAVEASGLARTMRQPAVFTRTMTYVNQFQGCDILRIQDTNVAGASVSFDPILEAYWDAITGTQINFLGFGIQIAKLGPLIGDRSFLPNWPSSATLVAKSAEECKAGPGELSFSPASAASAPRTPAGVPEGFVMVAKALVGSALRH